MPASVPRDEIREHLERVLSSPHFRHSRRCSALLRYVVEQTLANPEDGLKERIIGRAVFDREPGYDTNQDAVVRNAAAEVRKRLAQYYVESGKDAGLRIDLPSGSYVPEFRHAAPAVAPPPAVVSVPDRRQRVAPWMLIAVGAVLGILSTLAIVRSARVSRSSPTEIDQFWAPVLSAAPPVQICVGQTGMNYYPQHLTGDDKALSSKSLVPMRDLFYWQGDAIAMSRAASYLTAHDKLYRIRGAQVTPYAELQGNPVVLVGAFDNAWTLRLTQDLRFSLVNGGPDVRGVRDRERGEGLTWRVTRSAEGWIADEDYALVTRFADPVTGQTVISAGGITTYGTQAAGDFLVQPQFFREALRSAPKDWSRKNIQVVLRIRIADGTPAPPKVIAAHFW